MTGEQPADAITGQDEIEDLGRMTDTAIDRGELVARVPGSDQPDEPPAENLELLVGEELRAGETADPVEASDEGLTWVPPTDPPVTAGPDGEPQVAAGFGTTADDEPYDADHHGSLLPADDERTARVVEALGAHAATAGLVDRLSVELDGPVVVLSGRVEDLVDEDAAIAVAAGVTGVGEVVSRIEVRAVER